MFIFNKNLFLIIFFIVGFFLLPSQSQAISISPIRQVITISAGENKTIFLELKNNENIQKNYQLSVLGVEQNNEGTPIFRKKINLAEDWVKPEFQNIKLDLNEEKKVSFDINVPQGVVSGNYYLGLVVQEVNDDFSSIALSGQVVSLLFLQVSGEAREDLQILNWKKNNLDKDHWNFILQIKNKGNVDFPLSGLLKIKNWRGEIKEEKIVYLGNNLLPQTERNLGFISPTIISWPMIYQAEILINYGLTKQTVSQTIYFLYLPWWFWFILILFLTLFFLSIIVVIKNRYYGWKK